MTRKELGQSLNLEINHIPAGRPNRPGAGNDPKHLTIHNTDNTDAGADARQHAKFLNNKGYYEHNGKKIWVSWHYTADDGRIVNHLPIQEVSWHSGSGNRQSIGIEICMNKGIDQKAAFDRAARLCACLLYDLKLEVSKVVPHYRWTGKNCPSLLMDNKKPGAKWAAFLKLVEDYRNSIKP